MAYNLLGLKSRVRTKLGDSSYDATAITDALNDTQIEISNLFHWKFFEKVVEGTLTIGEYTYEQQDDHQLTYDMILLDPADDTKYWKITDAYLTKQEFLNRFPVVEAFDNSKPYYWTEIGDQIYFNCPSDDEYRLRQYYYRLPTDMDADADVPDFPVDFREALILGAVYRLQSDEDNYDFAQVTQNKFNEKVEDLISRYSVRQLAEAEYTIVGKRSDRNDPWSK